MRRRAPRLALAGGLVAAALAAGCGSDGPDAGVPPAATAAPSQTPYSTAVRGLGARPRVRLPASVRRRLAAGDVAVVDFTARASIAPAALAVNQEQTLEDVRWTGWGSPRATGRARVRSLECDPDCARGRIVVLDGTVALSDVRLCGSRRFYARAELETTDRKTGTRSRPATYLRTPC